MALKFKSTIKSQGSNVGSRKKPSIKTSVFGVTINPNISTTYGSKQHSDLNSKLLKAANDLFGNEENFKKTIEFRKEGHEWNDDYIVELKENTHTVEYDEKHKKLHIQGIIHIRHRSNIKLNINYIKDKISSILGIDPRSIHLEIKTNYNEKKAEDYPLKDVDA